MLVNIYLKKNKKKSGIVKLLTLSPETYNKMKKRNVSNKQNFKKGQKKSVLI